VDDGQVVIQSSKYFENCLYRVKCSKFIDQTFEFGSGRFRPAYWLINNINYELFKNNTSLHHIYRVYAVGLATVLLLSIILLDLGVSVPVVLVAVFIFFSTFSFSENIIRLGTNEPYQVLFLGAFSYLFLNSNKLEKLNNFYFTLLIGILTWALLIKEIDVAIIPAIILTEILIRGSKIPTRRLMLLCGPPLILFFSGVVITRLLPSSISPDIPNYVSNYVTHPLEVLNNSMATIGLLFNLLSPYLKIGLLLLPIIIVDKEIRESLFERKVLYWALFSIFFVGIMFPWRYVLDRYQLVSIFGLTILISIVLSQAVKMLGKYVFNYLPKTKLNVLGFKFLIFYVFINLFFKGFPVNLARTVNYKNWFETFTRFEAEQVKGISGYNNKGIYINGIDNLNDWEALYEIPIHLRYLYELEPNTELYQGSLSSDSYLFSRSAFDSYLSLEEVSKLKSTLLVSESYKINQIDPLVFRDRFTMKPIETILNPPLKEEGYNYYWEIRQIKK
jgi:hypothetical protein